MKGILYTTVVLFFIGFSNPTHAQVSVNINIGAQPSWGPSGYDYARYYYMPELDVYYDVPNRSYVYLHGNRWVTHRSLPQRYRGTNMHRIRKIVINDAYPWKRHSHYRTSYRHHSPSRSKQIHRREVREFHRIGHKYEKRPAYSRHPTKGNQKKHHAPKKRQHHR